MGVPRPKGEIVLIAHAGDVHGSGTLYQWQELDPNELSHCHFHTSGLKLDGSLKLDYLANEWGWVPVGHLKEVESIIIELQHVPPATPGWDALALFLVTPTRF